LLFLRGGSVMHNQSVLLGQAWAEESRGETAYAAAPGILVAVSPAPENAPFPRWIDREGKVLAEVDAVPSSEVRLSPDGRWIAFRKFTESGREIWLKESRSESEHRLTSGSNAVDFVFHPDSKKLAFGSDLEGPFNIYTVDVSSGERPQRLTRSPHRQFPKCWGNGVLLYEEERPDQAHDIVALPDNGEPFDVVATRFDEREPALSPDGKWLAYQSDQSGAHRIYLKAFPKGSPRILTEGTEPAWTAQGHLIFRQGDALVEIQNLEVPSPRTLFTHNFSRPGRRMWDLTPDGQRFLVLDRSSGPQEVEIWAVLNHPGLR
jgi:serine/threonine-protein kinase